jgi:two-component system NtrC family sensor kinase
MLDNRSGWLSRQAFIGLVAGIGVAAAWLLFTPAAAVHRLLAAAAPVVAGYTVGVAIASGRRHAANRRYILRLREELRLCQDHIMETATFRSLGLYLDGAAATLRGGLDGLEEGARALSEAPSLPADSRQAAERLRERVVEARSALGPLAGYAIAEPARAPFGLNDLVRESIDLCRHRAEEKKIRFDERYAVVPPVFGPGARTQQALLNVVINAIEAMPFAGGTISAETFVEGDRVIARFRDQGIGIRPEHLSRVFDPFFSTKPDRKGCGLGLWSARETLRLIGGDLTLNSAPHQGTEVRFNFPQAAPLRGGRAGEAHAPEVDRNTADEGDRRIA